jgi:hypothetical protein
MSYIHIITKRYPVNESEIRAAYPNTSFPAQFVPPPEYAWVFPTPVPSHDANRQAVQEVAPVKTNKWEQRWAVVDLPPDVVEANLKRIREERAARIRFLRDDKTLNGGYAVDGKWFHSDTKSRTQQIGLVMLGENIPAGLEWKTMDGTFVPMTAALAQKVFEAAAAQDIAIFEHAEKLLADESLDVSAGWPATFGG